MRMEHYCVVCCAPIIFVVEGEKESVEESAEMKLRVEWKLLYSVKHRKRVGREQKTFTVWMFENERKIILIYVEKFVNF